MLRNPVSAGVLRTVIGSRKVPRPYQTGVFRAFLLQFAVARGAYHGSSNFTIFFNRQIRVVPLFYADRSNSSRNRVVIVRIGLGRF